MNIEFNFSGGEWLLIESGSTMAEILIYACLLSCLILAFVKVLYKLYK